MLIFSRLGDHCRKGSGKIARSKNKKNSLDTMKTAAAMNSQQGRNLLNKHTEVTDYLIRNK